jgi:hypothetical protein
MADTKITALAAITTVDPAADVLPIVDISDTSMAASGTTKKITTNQILGSGGTATLASATISGDLTVNTNVLKVDSTNDRVGVLTATPGFPLHVNGTDSNNVLFNGVTKGIRFSASASTSSISGVDNTGNLSYQPLTIEASTLNFSLSGTTAMTLNSTGLCVGASPDHKLQAVGGYVASGKLSSASSGNIGGLLMYCSTDNAGRRSWGLKAESGLTGVLGFWVSSANNTEPFSGSQVMSLDTSGNLLVGTTSGTLFRIISSFLSSSGNGGIKLIDSQSNNTAVFANFSNGTGTLGSITNNNNAGVSYNINSDYRLKESVQPLTGGLARINALKPSIYKWKSNGSSGEGFLAHELAEVVPFAVSGEKDAVNADGSIKSQGIDMSRIVPILVAAIKELTAEVNALKNA